ncbi:MAG: MarR family transcriptional regulator [Chloroflexi bacterium]|nr:MarR family transcriptional regulator [Chloroflexota bacterium]MDL1885374.1 MarR family transcriptional regulator [Anaerolineae bacterium CFX8]
MRQVFPVVSDLENDVTIFWTLLFRVVLDAEKRLAANLAAHELTPPQFYVLKTLVEQGGRCPIGEIARLHHLTNATMTGMVKRLEAMTPPLVSRQPHTSDRRSVVVSLTQAGQERFLAVQADVLVYLRAVLSMLTGEERQDLIRYFSRYVALSAGEFIADES